MVVLLRETKLLVCFSPPQASLNVMNDNELELLENLALMQGHITSSFVS